MATIQEMDTGEDTEMVSTDDVQVVEVSKCCESPVWATAGGDSHTCECCGEEVEPRADGLWSLLANLDILGINWRRIQGVKILGKVDDGSLRLRIDHDDGRAVIVQSREPR